METTNFDSQTYKTTPSRELRIDFFPSLTTSKGCIIFLHGGALLLGSRKDLPENVVNFLINKGWDVSALDYRAISECPVPEIVKDVRDGCSFIREKYPTKPLILCGYSAGAYLALQHGTATDLVDGIIAFAGYGDLGADWYFSPSEFFLNYKNVDYVESKINSKYVFTTLEERIDLYVYLRQKGLWPHYVLGEKHMDHEIQRWSPIQHISDSFPRTVLIHGDKDCDVPVATSKEMSSALLKHNVPHELLILPNFDHDLFQQLESPEVSAAWNRAIAYLLPK